MGWSSLAERRYLVKNAKPNIWKERQYPVNQSLPIDSKSFYLLSDSFRAPSQYACMYSYTFVDRYRTPISSRAPYTHIQESTPPFRTVTERQYPAEHNMPISRNPHTPLVTVTWRQYPEEQYVPIAKNPHTLLGQLSNCNISWRALYPNFMRFMVIISHFRYQQSFIAILYWTWNSIYYFLTIAEWLEADEL